MERPNLLIVDDDKDLLRILRLRFEARGYRVFTAEDGNLALHLFDEERPESVLLDIRMPRLDGIAVLREMLAAYPAARVIVVSGDHSEDRARMALAEGARDFVPKPLDLAHLERTLEFLSLAARAGAS
jgi:two-component system response regulator GlrR